jgi:hypothetical protein
LPTDAFLYMKKIRIGLIDGGVGSALSDAVAAAADFGAPVRAAPIRAAAALTHGTNVARLVLEGLPSAQLLSARVFHERLDANVEDVVAAVAWLLDQGVDLINMSFGLRKPSAALEHACWVAREAGVLLVAAAPARGGPVFPAACRACIAVSGDARCQPGEVSWLGIEGVDFGTHPFLEPGSAAHGGGASYATARFTGLVSALLAQGMPSQAVRTHLFLESAWAGAEQRHA